MFSSYRVWNNSDHMLSLINDHLAINNTKLEGHYGGQNVARLKIEPQHYNAMAQSVTLQRIWELEV